MKPMLKTWSLRLAANLACSAAMCWSAWAATPPANDNFASAELITILQGSVTGWNVDATREDGEPDHAGNQSGASIWWKIIPPESGYLTLSTFRSLSRDGRGVEHDQFIAASTPIYSCIIFIEF